MAESSAVQKQYEYDPREAEVKSYELADPIGDDAHSPVQGIVHRYPDRVLFKITDTCAVYCRFCFRKEMVGKGAGVLRGDALESAFKYIESHKNIREVILSGGDPLTLSPRRLKELLSRLDAFEHIDNLRIHTRAPLAAPERVSRDLCRVFQDLQKPLYIVLHVNHADELTDDVTAALKKLHQSGAVLLSQSVLLKDINDNAQALETLCRALIRNRVKPYYLHHLDPAPGTSHFRVSIEEGQELMRALRGNLSGIALPTYVLDIPGGSGKIPVGPVYADEIAGYEEWLDNHERSV